MGFLIETIRIKTNTNFQTLELSPNDWLIPSTSYITCIYFYDIHQWSHYEKQSNETFLNVEQLIRSLNKLLDYYPLLNGSLKSDYTVSIDDNDDEKGGILFVSTKVNLPLKDISFSTALPLINSNHQETLFHIRHTRFQCGSVALGISLNHQIADAHSYFQLIVKDWVQLYRNLDYQSDVCHQRSLLRLSSEEINELKKTNPYFNDRKSLAVIHQTSSLPTKEIIVKSFRFTNDELVRMKSDALTYSSLEVDYLSTFEVLTAHLYQHVILARNLSSLSTSKLYMSTNIRPRLTQPNIPFTYFGNAIMFSYLEVPMSEVIQSNHLGLLASRIHDAIERNNTEDIRTTLAWIQCQTDIKSILPTWNLDETDFTISAWNKMGMYSNADFEFNVYPSRIILPPDTKYNGAANLLSTELNDGSIDVFLGLEVNEMKRLEENCDFRKYLF